MDIRGRPDDLAGLVTIAWVDGAATKLLFSPAGRRCPQGR
jgi:hypothetical protein